MAGGIPLSAKFDVSIAEPLDSKLESVSTFSELASTEFPYKGMQKLVEDEGDNGVIYVLGTDLTTWNVLVGDVDSVNGEVGIVVLDASNIAEVTDKNYVTDAEKTVIGNTSGTNTGDQDLSAKAEKAILTQSGGNVTGSIDTDTNTFSLTDSGGSNSSSRIDWEKEEQSITGFIESSLQQEETFNAPILLSEQDYENLTVYSDAVYIIPQVAKYFGSQLLERYSDIVDNVNDIFVTKSGNDTTGDGSSSNPYLTLEKAFSEASSNGGITIWMGDGEYAENVSSTGYFIQTSKSYTSPLTIKSIKNNNPVLTAQSGSFVVRFNGVNSNVIWDGITFKTTSTSVNCFNVSGTSNFDDLEFRNCVFKDENNKTSSISISGGNLSTNIKVKRCAFDSTGDFRPTFQNCENIDYIGNQMLSTGGLNPKLFRAAADCSGLINVCSNSASLPLQSDTSGFYVIDFSNELTGGATVNIIKNKISCGGKAIQVKGGTELNPITLNIQSNEINSGGNGVDTIEFIDGGFCEFNVVNSQGANCIGLPFDAVFSGAYSVRNVTVRNNVIKSTGLAGHGLLFGERSDSNIIYNNISNAENGGRHALVLKGENHKVYENLFYCGDSDGIYLKGSNNSEVYKNITICNIEESNALRYEPDASNNQAENNNVRNNKFRVKNGFGLRINQAASIGDNNVQDKNYWLVEGNGYYGFMFSSNVISLEGIRNSWGSNYPTGTLNSVNSENLENY